jgi:hypothetical protein
MYKVSITAENYFVQVKPSILGDVAKFTSIRQTCDNSDAVVTGCEISVYFYYEDVLNNTGYDTIIISSGDSGQMSPTGYTLTTLYGVSAYYTYTTCPGYQSSIGLCPGIFGTTTTTTTSTTTTTTTLPKGLLPPPLLKYDQYSSSLTAGTGGKWTNLGTTGSYADLISSGSITSGGTGTGTYLILNQGSTVNQCLFASASRGINLGQTRGTPYTISTVVKFTNLARSTFQTIIASITGSGTGTREDSYYLSISGFQIYGGKNSYNNSGSYSVISWIPGVQGSQGFGPVYPNISENKWYHLLSTYNGDKESNFYINGAPILDPEGGPTTPAYYYNQVANTPKSRLVIGNAFISGSMSTSTTAFSGHLAAIAIYTGSNAYFTSSQVQVLYREYASRFTLG